MGDRIAMVIVVECESCDSRFRVKRTLLDGSFAIRFRCRTCGGYIVVRNPEMRKIAAVPAPTRPFSSLSTEASAEPATLPEPEVPAVASMSAPPAAPLEPEMPATVDEPPPSDSYIAPEMPVVASKPAPPGAAGLEAVRLEDLVPFVPEGEVRAARNSSSVTGAVKRVSTEIRSTAFKKRPWAIGILSFFVGLGILLLASGAYNFGVSNPWERSAGKKSPIQRSSGAASVPLKPAYDVQNLDSYIPREAIAGNLFVITGTVKNVGKAPSRGIRIQATLFGKDKKVLVKQASIAGNYIDKFTLPYMMRTTIIGHLAAARYEEGSGNNNIHPGNSLPFIVVCFDPPGKVESYEVLATNAEL